MMNPAGFLLVTLGAVLLMSACHTRDSDEQSAPSSHTDAADLEKQIRQITDEADGTFAVAFLDVDGSSGSVFLNADEWFHAASTMKTPVMIEVHRQAMENKFDLDDKLPVVNEFISIADGKTYELSVDRDSGDALYDLLGSEMSIRELAYSMIVRSGNLATNLVIEHVGAENVNRTMENIGADGIRVLRGVEDMAAFRAGMNNEVTARGLAVMFEQLAKGEILNEEARSEIISVLKDQYHRNMIPSGLPEEVEVAHKTGSITGVTHDSGIVYLPDGRRYVLVILAKDLEDRDAGRRTGAKISEQVYHFMMSRTPGSQARHMPDEPGQ